MDKIEVKKYLRRNDMKKVAEKLGISPNSVTDAMRKNNKCNNDIFEILHLLAMKRKAQAELIANELLNDNS